MLNIGELITFYNIFYVMLLLFTKITSYYLKPNSSSVRNFLLYFELGNVSARICSVGAKVSYFYKMFLLYERFDEGFIS